MVAAHVQRRILAMMILLLKPVLLSVPVRPSVVNS